MDLSAGMCPPDAVAGVNPKLIRQKRQSLASQITTLATHQSAPVFGLSRLSPCGECRESATRRPILPWVVDSAAVRIVQYKMILKRELIPIQDDRENGGGGGGLRPDANTHAERRCTHPGTDPRVPQRQSIHRIHRPKPSRVVRICAAGVGRSGVRPAGQEAAGSGSGLPEQGHRAEPAADDATDSQIPPGGRGGSGSVPPAAFSGQIHQRRRGAMGGSGPRPRLAQRAGHRAPFQAGVRAVRTGRPCAPGGDLGRTPVPLAGQRAVPEAGGEVGAHAAQRGYHRGAAQAGSARASGVPAHRHGTPRRRGGRQGGCTPSMPWTR